MVNPNPRRPNRRLAARLRANHKVIFWTGAAVGLVGAATIAFPTISTVVVGAAAGWLLWFAGAAMIFVSLLVGAPGSFFGPMLAGLITIACGAFLLFNPLTGALATAVLIAAVLILDGALEIALALDLRPLTAWRWVLASAISSAIAGIIVAAGAAAWSSSALALILGTAFATTGIALMVLSRSAGAERRAENSASASHDRLAAR